MRKTILSIAIIFMLALSLFVLTGCGNDTKEELVEENSSIEEPEVIETTEPEETDTTEEVKTKEEFTQTFTLDDLNVEFKLPENSVSAYDYEDMGTTVLVDVTRHETDDFLIHQNDDRVETIEKDTINGYTYEHFKYVVDTDLNYVYRTKANGKYYVFEFSVLGEDYDDAQIEKLMKTVKYN